MCVFLVAYVSINTGIHKDMFRCTYVCIFLHTVRACVLWLDSLLRAVFVYLLAELGEPVYAFIREMPQGVVDSINPMRRREFLIPHHAPSTNLISSLRQYEWHNSTWMQASAVICRCDLNDLIIFMSERFEERERRRERRENFIKDIKWIDILVAPNLHHFYYLNVSWQEES